MYHACDILLSILLKQHKTNLSFIIQRTEISFHLMVYVLITVSVPQ
jgi:hypothetical protein